MLLVIQEPKEYRVSKVKLDQREPKEYKVRPEQLAQLAILEHKVYRESKERPGQPDQLVHRESKVQLEQQVPQVIQELPEPLVLPEHKEFKVPLVRLDRLVPLGQMVLMALLDPKGTKVILVQQAPPVLQVPTEPMEQQGQPVQPEQQGQQGHKEII